MAPAGASNCRSEASSVRVSAARRGSRLSTRSAPSRPWRSRTVDGHDNTKGRNMRLKDKVAIVTGGGSGFGEGISRRFAAEGAAVVVNDINETGGKRVAGSIAQEGGTAIFIRADVSRSSDVKTMVKTALDAYGRVDVMVNNAGFTHKNQPMLDVSEDVYDRVFAVNVKAIYFSTLEVVPI